MMRKVELLTALLAITAASAMADADDPPSRVARLNFQSGSVSFRPGSVEEWAAATLNYPLTTGDHLWTDRGAQAEIHVGSIAIRMAPETAMSILNLDDHTVQLSVTQGSVNVHIRNLADDESFEVDSPNMAATLLRPGDYRIDADGDNNVTTVTVRAGDVEVTGAGAAFPVHARESARISGIDTVSQDIGPAPPPGDFDRWCDARERREQQAQISARYVPRDMVGYEDLDEYGVWREDAQYGWVWAPRTVAIGWAPYHYGRWAWVEPWGWTWIDEAPWGFAPFHYGRWAFGGGGWFWVPGRMVVGVRPVYAPALVAFVGGPRFGIGFAVGGGGVAAWFPLGPGEVYRPAYRVSEVYVRQVNIVHVTNVNVINVTNVRYVNQNVQGAVTAVPHEAFISARPVAQASFRVDAREVAQAQVVGTTAQVAPRRESVMAHAGPAVAAPPARYAERAVVARSTPPPPPVSFAAKQQALQANQGRPLEPQQMNTLRSNSPAPRPMVRTLAPAPVRGNPQSQPNMTPRPQLAPPGVPRIDRPNGPVERPADLQRVERPAVVQPRPQETRPVEQPRTERPAVMQPRPQETRPVEQPRTERPAVMQPRPPETRPVEQPRTE
ncbi:MAG: FecR domain-containing protein, partial [Acidobacteriia bacterium]|nr:FecR domain-containing protein [Terriglobia bacterium]